MCGSNLASYIPPRVVREFTSIFTSFDHPRGIFTRQIRKRNPPWGIFTRISKKVKFPEGGMYDAKFERHIIIEDTRKTIDDNNFSVGVFIDHCILLSKLDHYRLLLTTGLGLISLVESNKFQNMVFLK